MVETIIFEENGFPVELGSAREVERAIGNGRLRADTLVRTGMQDGAPRTAPASQVAWLRPLLGLADSIEPEPVSAPVATGPVSVSAPAPAMPPSPPTAPTAPHDIVRPGGSTFWQASVPPRWDQAISAASPNRTTAPSSVEAGRSARRAAPARAPQSRYQEPSSVLARAIAPLSRYATFAGRSSPREFWAFAVLLFVAMMFATAIGQETGLGLLTVAIAVPSLAVAVRRCHDQNRSGWFVLICCLPYVGWLILLVLMAVPGTAGENRFGVNPMKTN